jgi:hypothetical protein
MFSFFPSKNCVLRYHNTVNTLQNLTVYLYFLISVGKILLYRKDWINLLQWFPNYFGRGTPKFVANDRGTLNIF